MVLRRKKIAAGMKLSPSCEAGIVFTLFITSLCQQATSNKQQPYNKVSQHLEPPSYRATMTYSDLDEQVFKDQGVSDLVA
jgi:hypothetical protein